MCQKFKRLAAFTGFFRVKVTSFSYKGLLSNHLIAWGHGCIYYQFLVCTANGEECVFPFKYKGITYNTCTKVESDNGKAWCALKLDSKGSGEVIIGQWADCDPICPVEPNPRGPGSSKNTSVLGFKQRMAPKNDRKID